MPCESVQFHRHFNARQRFAFPFLTSAFPYCSLASPFLCPAGLRGTMPLRSSARPFSSARSYSFAILLKSLRPVAFASRLIANPRSALALLCAATLYFAIPLPCPSAQRPADALLNIACLCSSATMLFTSMLFLCCACHRVSLFFNTSPSLCETSPSSSVAALRQSPLILALPSYASPRKASAVLLVPKQNSACPMQFLTVRRSTSPLLCLAPLHLALHHFAYPLLC